MTQTVARDTRRPPMPPPKGVERTCQWITRPFDLPTGGRMGFFVVRNGEHRDYYRCVRREADDMEQRWAVSKENRDGTFAEEYHVVLSGPGCTGRVGCGCKAFYFRGECRHVEALTVLLGQLN